jgi:uncharacterized cysteine cluster protein YcgN (CxxCxxCC family)
MTDAVSTTEEWETLCRGCGECCFEKIEDDNGTIFYLMTACRYLDLESRQCRIYENRFIINPDCVKLTANLVPTLRWLPRDCGYLAPPPVDVPPMPGRGRARRKRSR